MVYAVIRQHILEGTIIPLYNEEIFKEYTDVLHRPSLHLPTEQITGIKTKCITC